MPSYVMVYITAPSKRDATQLATLLVKKRLAACVNIHSPIDSLYHWQGKVESSKEYVLIAKTRKSLMPALTSAVKKVHTYDCPCVVALPITSGNAEFMRWIDEETRPVKKQRRVKR